MLLVFELGYQETFLHELARVEKYFSEAESLFAREPFLNADALVAFTGSDHMDIVSA